MKTIFSLAMTAITTQTGVTQDEMRSRDRHKHLTTARTIFCHLAYTDDVTMEEVAVFMCRDHSVVHHLIKTCHDRMDTNSLFKALVRRVDRGVENLIMEEV